MNDAAAEPSTPYPPRFRWMRRCLILSALGFVVLAGSWIWWSWSARRELNAVMAAAKSRGEPVWIGELNSARPLSAAENAADYLTRAARAISSASPPPAQTTLNYSDYPPYRPEWLKAVAAAEAANAQSLALIRAARDHDAGDWGIQYVTPSMLINFPHLNVSRSVAVLAGDTAMYQHLQGNDAEALERIRDVRHIARITDTRPFMITHLVSLGQEAIATSRVMTIAPDLAISKEGAANAGGAATRAQVETLIAELLNETRQGADQIEAIQNERVYEVDSAAWVTSNSTLLRPMFNGEMTRLAHHFDFAAEAARQPTAGEAHAVLGKDDTFPQLTQPKNAPRLFPQMEILRSMFWISTVRPIDVDRQTRADRRMAAVSLAVRLYRIDHEQWPPSLEALTPTYLKEVPLDPTAPTAKPIGYVIARGALPDGGDRPLVYSVGRNGTDDTVTAEDLKTMLPSEPAYSSGSRRELDEWRDLSRWSPPPAMRTGDIDPVVVPDTDFDGADPSVDPTTQPDMTDEPSSSPTSKPTENHEPDQPDDHRKHPE